MKTFFLTIIFIAITFFSFAQDKIKTERDIVISCSTSVKISLAQNELEKLRFVNDLGQVISHFKVKIMGTGTYSVNGNKLLSDHISKLKKIKGEKELMVFSAKPCMNQINGSRALIITVVE